MDNKRFFLWYLLPVILFCSFIIFLSSLHNVPTIRGVVSTEPVSPGSWTGDEVEHLILYGILAFLVYRVIIHTKYAQHAFLATIFFCVLFGIFDELHQSFVPTRTMSVRDIVWNFIASLTSRFSSVLIKKE